MNRVLALVALVALVVPAAGAALADPLMLRMGRMGEVTAQEAGPSEPARPGNVAGTTPVLDPRFIHLGPDVDGTPCRQFGLEFKATNLPPGVSVPVVVQLSHPLWTRPDGQSGTVETNISMVTSDSWTYVGYTLEEDWSMVPGPWTFTISQGPRVLSTASFNVSAEPGQHVPSGGCSSVTS